MKKAPPIKPAVFCLLTALTGCSVLLPQRVVHLPENFRHLSPRISSSGEPAGRGVFRALRNEGVQTIISVDGAAPEVEIAKREGLRYIHLPIGYDGVPNATIAALNKVLMSSSDRILIHCHHGKHRGPSAAVIACMIEGSKTREQALTALTKAGTSPDYTGLWRDVREFSGVPKDAEAQPLLERATIEPLADSMVRIDSAFEELGRLLSDQAPRASSVKEQAILLAEGFRESHRHATVMKAKTAMIDLLSDSEAMAKSLAASIDAQNKSAASRIYSAIKADCRSCHVKYRN
jgi:protein tyrosine phosphatase (PTP) superfamily phosphohydrolase (DUF442 family)